MRRRNQQNLHQQIRNYALGVVCSGPRAASEICRGREAVRRDVSVRVLSMRSVLVMPIMCCSTAGNCKAED